MEHVIIYEKNTEMRNYELQVYNPRNVLLIAFFLDEVGFDVTPFIAWLENSEDKEWHSELVDCDKEEGIVEFTPAYILEVERIYGTGNFFQIPINLLIDLLKQWAIIRPLSPSYIKITINDYRVEIKGCDTSEVFTIKNIAFMLEILEEISKLRFSKPRINDFPKPLYSLIRGELSQIKESEKNQPERFVLLERTIVYIFSQIKWCKDKQEAQEYFECLGKIQSSLALVTHKEDIGVPDRLWRFMSDFDNFEEAKEYYFDKIKTKPQLFTLFWSFDQKFVSQ